MKQLILFFAVFLVNFGYAQTTAQVSSPPGRDLDIVLIPFGIEHPINVGSLDVSGKVTWSGNMDISQVSKSEQADYILQMSEVLDFCDNLDLLSTQNEDIEAVELGALMLWGNGEPAGFLTLVTDTALFEWVMQDSNSPVVGSVFYLIYVKTDFDFSGDCKETFETESDEATTEFKLDIHFKPGLNFMEYEIQSIDQSGLEENESFPKSVSVTSHQKLPDNVIWMAYYY